MFFCMRNRCRSNVDGHDKFSRDQGIRIQFLRYLRSRELRPELAIEHSVVDSLL